MVSDTVLTACALRLGLVYNKSFSQNELAQIVAVWREVFKSHCQEDFVQAVGVYPSEGKNFPIPSVLLGYCESARLERVRELERKLEDAKVAADRELTAKDANAEYRSIDWLARKYPEPYLPKSVEEEPTNYRERAFLRMRALQYFMRDTSSTCRRPYFIGSDGKVVKRKGGSSASV